MAIEIDNRTRWIGGGIFVAAAAGAAAWWFSRIETPPYTLVLKDGPIEMRAYGTMRAASVHHTGDREEALSAGFRTLADYIFANSREGEKIEMTAPVVADQVDDGWRTRFILPARFAQEAPPAPPEPVAIETLPARRIAAIRFSGRADEEKLAEREAKLREWLDGYGQEATGPASYAFYNSPAVPAPLRRTEILLPVASIY